MSLLLLKRLGLMYLDPKSPRLILTVSCIPAKISGILRCPGPLQWPFFARELLDPSRQVQSEHVPRCRVCFSLHNLLAEQRGH